MSRRLTDEEIAERYSQQRRVETPQADLGTLFGSGVDRAQAAALGLLEPFGLSRDYRLAQQAEAEQSAQRYFETDPEAVGSFRNIRGVGDVGRYAAELGVQTAPAIAPILAAGLVGGPAAAYGVAGLTGIGEITQAQREQTGRPDLTAIPLGLAYGGVEAATGLVGRLAGTGVRAERALARADRALDAIPGLAGAAARTAASFGRTGVSEAVGEVGQEYITNVGRLAVDPNVELFSPEAIAGYQESAVGGALLGGLVGGVAGGWRRSPAGRREFEATQERDMTGGAVAPEQPQYGLVTEMTPLQQRINEQLGIGRRATPTNYVEQFKAAYDEPSGQFATDRETGLERQLSMGELVQLQGPAMDLTQGEPAKTAAATTMAAAAERDPVAQTMRDTFGVVPTPSAISLYNEIQASGIPLDSDLLIDVWKFAGERPMNLKRLDKARLLLDQAIIKARTAAPAAPVVSPPSGAPAVTTPAAPVAVGGSLAAPAAPVLVTPPAAPAPAPVVRPQPPAPLIDTSDEALETARATGNQALVGEIEALRGEAEGMRADAEDLTGEQLNTIVQRRFAKSKNAQRDAQILSAYLTALRSAPKGSSVAVQEAIGRQFGIGAQAVRKIGNPSALVAAGKELGYSTEQVLNVLNVDDNTKAQFTQVGQLEAQIKDLRKQYAAATGEAKTAIANQMARANEEIQRAKDAAEQERRAAFSAGLQEAGVETAEGETAGFGFDTDREWAKVEASGDATTQIMQLSDARDALRQALEEFQQVGNEAAVAEVAKRISDIDGQLEKLIRDTTKAAPKVETKAAPDVKAVQQRWKEAGRDITKLTTEDLNVLLPYVRDTIKNTALAKQITDTINSRGGQDAVQVQGTARVPVQPEARAGQEVGRQVRRAEEPAAEGQAQGQVAVRTTQEQYQALTAGFEAPAFAQLTERQQKQIADLAGRDQLNLAALNRILGAEQPRFARSAKSITVGNVTFQASEYSLDELRRNPGVNAALKRLEDDGLASLVGQVDTWLLVDDNADFDAAVLPYKGGQALAIRYNILQNRDDAEWNVTHELGHIQDGVLEGRNDHSEQPELNIQVSNGKIRPFGAVAREVFDYWKANRNTELGQRLDYPFDATKFGDLDSQRVREELWAQLWSMFINPRTNFDMEEAMPTAFRFMEIEYEAAKQVAAASQAAGAADIAEAKEQARQTAKGDLRASRSAKRARQGLIDRNINKLPQQLRQPANNIVGALGDLMGRGLDYVVFTSDLVGRAVQAGMPAAQRFATALANSKSAASERERRVEKIADMYATIEEANKGSGPGSANEFLFESTRTGKWGYGKYRDAKMGAMFDALGPKAQAFVKAVFQHGDTMLSEKKTIVLDAANSEYDAMIAIAKRDGDKDAEAKLKAEKVATLKRFDSLFKIREGLPYAPIKRSGSWAVVSRSPEYQEALSAGDTKRVRELEQNPDHYQVSFVDSKWEARTLQAKIDQEFAGLSTDIVKRAEAMDDFSGKALLPALTSLRAKVDAERGTANTKVHNIISQLYLEALAEDSARKSEMRRRGISGEVDMLSSFTTQGRADANFLASVEYSPEIQDALQQMRSQSKTGDVTRKTELFDEISSRYTQSLDYNVNPWVNKLTSLSSKYFLATSPGYYLQNLTQPFMMSVPAMAGRHDYAKVGQAMWKAYSELGPLFKNTKLFDQQFDFTQVPADVRAAVDELVKRGKIDIGLATEINEFKVDADNKLSQFAQRLNKGMRMAVQKAEAINRLSTAMAAYRLELAKSGSKDKAIEYADRILTETHGDYTAFNAPRIFNSNFGKIALQFRKFQLIQIAFYAKLLRDAFTKPQERAAALRTLGYSLAHSGVFAGALGLPGYAAVAALSGFLFGDEDEPFDLTEEMRKALGPEWSQLIMRGVPTLAGVDLSGKIGSGQMLSIAPFADIDLTTQAGVTQAIGTIAGGATGGMAARMLDGLGLIMNGDIYRGTEQVMPKGIGDMLKAGRISGEGLTRRNGDVILSDEDVSQVGQLFAAIGLPSVKVTETYQARQSALDLEKNFTERATKVKNQYAKAFRERDTEAMAEAREAWKKLQDARKRNDLKPQPMSSLLRAPQEQRKREQKIAEQID